MTTLSRQRTWQLARKAEGNCETCGKPAQGRTNCDECAGRYYNIKRRYPLKGAWDDVDFREPVAIIAARLGVTYQAVYKQKKKRN
jgi:hypothetical protein